MDDVFQRSIDQSAFINALQSITIESCPSQFNFHLHTQHSDGQSEPLELFDQAIQIGIQGMAITDHHSVGGFEVIRNWLNHSDQDLSDLPYLWTGVEITSALLSVDVHILGFAFNPYHSSIKPYLTGESVTGEIRKAENVIAAIHDANGVAILAHPHRYRKDAEPLIDSALQMGLDGIEAYYCYGRGMPWKPSQPQTSELLKIGDRHNLLVSCGTDTHGLDITCRR